VLAEARKPKGGIIVLIWATCGGNASIGTAGYCGLDDILTCGDCDLICRDKGEGHNLPQL
jgi:hypothetical protein